MGLAILFLIALGAVMGVIFWQRRKRIRDDMEDVIGKFRKDIEEFKNKRG